jgi:uncharacterized protein (TIGR02186 family)
MIKAYIILPLFLLGALVCGAGGAFAQGKENMVSIDLASDRVDITTGFTGSRVVVFGVADTKGDVAIVLRGPESRIVVRKKQQAMGIWLNRESVEFLDVPRFYDYAASRDESAIAQPGILSSFGIGLDTLVFEPKDPDDPDMVSEFHEALLRTRQEQGNFPLHAGQVKWLGNGLFRTEFYLPANVPTGSYDVEAFLFSKGELVGRQEKRLRVEQAGASAEILRFAMNYSLAYAFVGLLLAASAGLLSVALSRGQK